MTTPALVLAFDTSTEQLALAVGHFEDSSITPIALDDHLANRQANVQLLPSIDALLASHDLCKRDITAVVCGLGPGSFTGVRIAVASAKGIARGLGVPLYGLATTDALAWNAWLAGVRGPLAVVMDAMRGEVYPARFALSDAGVIRLDPHAVAKADVAAARWREEIVVARHETAGRGGSGEEREASQPLQLVGDGLRKFAEAFVTAPADDGGEVASRCSDALFTLLPESLWLPTGAGLLRAFEASCAVGMQGSGEAGALLPIYTRLSDAEENERKRLASGGALTQGALVEVPRSGVADPCKIDLVTYRPMALSDLDQVCALEDAVFSMADSGAPSGERWTRAAFEAQLQARASSWWVACLDDLLLGFAGGRRAGSDFEVLDVAVAPSHRRRHIATELLRHLRKDGEDLGATSLILEVRASNEAAQALYASLGLEQVGERKGYYTSPQGGSESALLMRSSSQINILALETSCDETAAAIVDGEGMLLANVIASQVDFHARFGGVVPEIASRKHTEAIVGVVDEALEQASKSLAPVSLRDLDAIAVTYAPGLIGALVVGVAFAKGASWAADLPLIFVNHLEGHIYANRLQGGERDGTLSPHDSPSPQNALSPPFVIALLSGGHTMLVHVRDWGSYHVLGQTLDDAVGEAFDKVAKALGLGYPGGPVISRLALEGNPTAIDFPRALLHSHDLQFSLSGL
ncbi:MAG: tRNA (adenosine(37)-N6)-threonylcarbamoyltransferase complex dimerization subunit type 1 TsaB, partial [Coriobacteriales bacterium]|nr:tRNA (adenosine(37)-N6)-threonylcarbamoyltransferase complex dimerization subunit type 1 TsaB [Coriobacteriales bacterium]